MPRTIIAMSTTNRLGLLHAQDSVGAGDADSCEYNQGGKDCYMPRDSVGGEHINICENNQGGMDCYMPQDSCEYNLRYP